MMKFPKPFSDDPAAPKLASYLEAKAAPLRADSDVRVPRIPFPKPLQEALLNASKSRAVVVGLEQIQESLAREEKGLEAVRKKAGQEKSARLSRLVLLANDGSDRFYRGAEAILRSFGYRVGVIIVEIDAEELGKAFLFKGNLCRAVMINDKTWVARVLAAMA